MSSPKTWAAGLLVFAVACSPRVWAQIPAAGAPPGGASTAAATALGGAGGGAATPAAAPAAAAPQTIWGFFGLSGANIHACIAKLCNTQLGQMANSLVTGPMGAVSGGFIPPLCPPPTPQQIAAMDKMAPGGAEATAAKIKASEADAKARVAAVEYLGTVDCSRWKEATKALVNALRADTNECVRYAAARVLNSGCCCNKNTIEALKICVAGEDKDGNPPETSFRVKGAAFSALQNCLMRVPEVLPEEVKPEPIKRERGSVPNLEPLPGQKPLGRERSTMNDGKDIHLAGSLSVAGTAVPRFEDQLQRESLAQTVSEARQTLFDVSRSTRPPANLPPGKRSVFNAFVKARQDINTKARPAPPAAPAPSDPGVVPSSHNPSSGDSQGVAIPAPASGAGPMSAEGNPESSPNPSSAAESKRGLIGSLLNFRTHGTDQ